MRPVLPRAISRQIVREPRDAHAEMLPTGAAASTPLPKMARSRRENRKSESFKALVSGAGLEGMERRHEGLWSRHGRWVKAGNQQHRKEATVSAGGAARLPASLGSSGWRSGPPGRCQTGAVGSAAQGPRPSHHLCWRAAASNCCLQATRGLSGQGARQGRNGMGREKRGATQRPWPWTCGAPHSSYCRRSHIYTFPLEAPRAVSHPLAPGSMIMLASWHPHP